MTTLDIIIIVLFSLNVVLCLFNLLEKRTAPRISAFLGWTMALLSYLLTLNC